MCIYCRFSVNASKWQVEFIEKQDDKVSTTVHENADMKMQAHECKLG